MHRPSRPTGDARFSCPGLPSVTAAPSLAGPLIRAGLPGPVRHPGQTRVLGDTHVCGLLPRGGGGAGSPGFPAVMLGLMPGLCPWFLAHSSENPWTERGPEHAPWANERSGVRLELRARAARRPAIRRQPHRRQERRRSPAPRPATAPVRPVPRGSHKSHGLMASRELLSCCACSRAGRVAPQVVWGNNLCVWCPTCLRENRQTRAPGGLSRWGTD